MTILLTILGIAALIVLHELGHFLTAKFFGLRVDEFGIGFPPRLFGRRFGETMYSVNALPLGGFVKIHGESGEEAGDPRSFSNAPAGVRSAVIVAGVVMNFLLGWALLSLVLFVGTPSGILVEGVMPGSPAEVAGFTRGDFIEGFETSAEFISFVDSQRGNAVEFRVRGGNGVRTVSVVPRLSNNEGEGALGVVVAEAGVPAHGFFESIWRGLNASFQIMGSILYGLWRIVATLFGEGKLMEGFVGPIGVFGIAAESVKSGLIFFLQLLGLISLNLAVLNVLPFPALDGGRFLFIIFEKIKGAKLSPSFEATVNMVGFSLLIALILAVTVRDVTRLF